jgi:hypothetical protein
VAGVRVHRRFVDVLKIDRLDRVREEESRYQGTVARLLPAGSFAPLVDTLGTGAGRFGATAYALAEGYAQLFDLFPGGSVVAAEALAQLRAVDSLDGFSNAKSGNAKGDSPRHHH